MLSVAAQLLTQANVDVVNRQIVAIVARDHDLRILPQSTDAVRSVLVREFRNWNDERSTIPGYDEPTTVSGVVAMLSARAASRAASACAENYRARVRFIEDQSTLPVPLAHATNESIRGTQLGDMGASLEI